MPISRDPGEVDRHRLIRRVLCARGSMKFRRRGRAPLRLRQRQHAHRRRPADWRSSRHRRSACARPRRAARSTAQDVLPAVHAGGRARPRSSPSTASPAGPNRDPCSHAEAAALFERDRRVLAAVAVAVALPRPLARDGAPLGAGAEAAHLRADRGASSRRRRRACPSRSAASATGTTGTPGSATPRSRVYALLAARLHRGGRGASCGWLRALRASGATSPAPAPDHVRHRRPAELAEQELAHLEGYRGSRPGAHRQRRGRPAPARHLRRAARLGLPLQQVRRADHRSDPGTTLARARRLGLRATGTSPTRGSGRRAAGARTSSTRA